MGLLLDTHVFLWWLETPALLSRTAREAIANEQDGIYVSAIVLWEIAIKKMLGKLNAPDNLEHTLL